MRRLPCRSGSGQSLSSGLPLALPFVARSLASASGEGALATFNYAWKLVELPLLLAIQLAATPGVSRRHPRFGRGGRPGGLPLRRAFALAWVLACAAMPQACWPGRRLRSLSCCSAGGA
jgi:putative peptidoglycan lipid II flippase